MLWSNFNHLNSIYKLDWNIQNAETVQLLLDVTGRIVLRNIILARRGAWLVTNLGWYWLASLEHFIWQIYGALGQKLNSLKKAIGLFLLSLCLIDKTLYHKKQVKGAAPLCNLRVWEHRFGGITWSREAQLVPSGTCEDHQLPPNSNGRTRVLAESAADGKSNLLASLC